MNWIATANGDKTKITHKITIIQNQSTDDHDSSHILFFKSEKTQSQLCDFLLLQMAFWGCNAEICKVPVYIRSNIG